MSEADTVVYTAIYGGYDHLIEPRYPADNIDYICFTDDQTLTSDVWDVRVPNVNPDLPPNLKNRRVKILAHEYLPEYDYSVYVDGNVGITASLRPLINKYREEKFVAPTHPVRDCVYDEAEACLKLNKGDPESIRAQIEAYRDEGLPEEWGLTANRLLLRQHTSPDVKQLMKDWWRELETYSSRDQLSLPFVLWKHDVDVTLMDSGPETDSNRFVLHRHLPDQQPLRWLTKWWIRVRNDRDVNTAYLIQYYIIRGLQKARREGVWSTLNALVRVLGVQTRERLLAVGDRLGVVGPDSIYEAGYYEKRRYDPFRAEARHMGQVFDEVFEPNSVIDFGCAIGAYLEPFHEKGIKIHGVEANSSAFEYAVVPRGNLTQHDLREPFRTEQQYDLVISIEVAEHIPAKYADTYVDTLTKAGDTVVMSAAPPGQGGTHHVNEKPRKYWIEKMNQRGFEYDSDAVASVRTRANTDVFSHVPENIMVFQSQ
ncbi:glycosyltransferase domain-containing protein [Halobaculum sp. EA56]|uniref:glycosyltransferase domain-containing protein n=1 Tax=Halobaculum sp. EA56 TaxID=3421648 RepID=UPI003EB6CD9E